MSNFISKYYRKYQSRWFWPCATAVFCAAFYLLHFTKASLFSSITAFPFWQLGLLLRELSSKGGLENAVSLVLFTALFLLPLSGFGLLTLKHRHIAADWLLVLFSLLQAFILYGYVNPPLFTYIFPAMLIGSTGATDSLPQIVPAILGITLWSVLFAWILLRFLHSLKASGAAFPPSSYFLSLLRILSILFTADIFFTLFGELPEAISALQDKNTGAAASAVSLTAFFLALRFIVQALPSLFHLGIVLMIQKLLQKTSPSALPLLDRLFSFSRTGLVCIVLSQMVMNLLQLIMGAFLLDIDITLTFPFLSICFLIAVLLFSRLLEDNIRLKADMELFI